MEIHPKTTEEAPINNNPAVGDSQDTVVQVPQEMLEYFNIKPEDNITTEETMRLQDIYLTSKKIFPSGNLGEIMRFVSAVERANPALDASETDRLFNIYKNFKLGRIYE